MWKKPLRGGLLFVVALALSMLPFFSKVSFASDKENLSYFQNIFGLHVQNNTLENMNGKTVRLLGVNRSGTEYMCAANAGIFDGPDDAASVDAMASWHITAVRIPLNEDCWLGINGVPAQYAGLNYQFAIIQYVALLNSRGIVPILDLHWTAPGTTLAVGQRAMTDADHSIAAWQSIANVFKYNTSVIFDLFNEPYVSNWDCWKYGSTTPSTAPCSDVNFAVAGMQTLVDTVRGTGAKNVIMLSGIGYANWLGGWTDAMPNDSAHNLIASVHIYNFSGCTTTSCFDQVIGPVAATVPVVIGELGENDCQHGFVDSVMDWADQNGIGYLGWAWDTYDCSSFPSLISSYDGTPTQFGLGFQLRFAKLA